MRIFLSHSGKQKPLIREIRNSLPEHLGTWIDEEQLLFGDNLEHSIESVIKSETDYVVLFIDDHAISSPWVNKEIEWTMDSEKKNNRTILLPVLIEPDALEKIDNVEIRNRKYLSLKDFQEHSVRSLAASIASELFALVCRDVDQLRNPKTKTSLNTLTDADALIRDQAALIQKIVFPHRQSNPISKGRLLEVINSYNERKRPVNPLCL